MCSIIESTRDKFKYRPTSGVIPLICQGIAINIILTAFRICYAERVWAIEHYSLTVNVTHIGQFGSALFGLMSIPCCTTVGLDATSDAIPPVNDILMTGIIWLELHIRHG